MFPRRARTLRNFHKLIHDNMGNTQQSYLDVTPRGYKSISMKCDDDFQSNKSSQAFSGNILALRGQE